nr:MAG TPA: hypothetical protein [Caudoviricetes sp.]
MWLALNRKCYDDYSSVLSPYRLATKVLSFTNTYNRPSTGSTEIYLAKSTYARVHLRYA